MTPVYRLSPLIIALFFLFSSSISYALTFSLPKKGNSLVGRTKKTIVQPDEDVIDLGQKFQVGYYEFLEANDRLDMDNLYYGTELVVPTRYILPNVSHRGIVINLAEMRLYYYPPDKPVVITYPIGIGREGTNTPIVKTKIIGKRKNPTWRPTKDTIKRSLKMGISLPNSVPPGPENPLGDYAMRLGLPSYLIHGTNDPAGIGLRSTAGCIRLYPENVAKLYPLIAIGTPVNIINEPYKAGWYNNKLYLEAHVPIGKKPDYSYFKGDLDPLTKVIMPLLKNRPADINWEKAIHVATEKQGIPEVIGRAR